LFLFSFPFWPCLLISFSLPSIFLSLSFQFLLSPLPSPFIPTCKHPPTFCALSLHRSGTWESVCWCKRVYPAVPGSNSFITPVGLLSHPAHCLYADFLCDTPLN
jgi:hypothetical protein